MSELGDSFVLALKLIFTGDHEVLAITARTLAISCSSTFFAALICIPIACLIHFNSFRGKRTLITVLQTFYALPTVLVGLLVFILFSRAGPLGPLGLLFSPRVMVIGQVVLISPLMTGLTVAALKSIPREIRDTCVSMGTTRLQMVRTVLIEARYGATSAILIGFGRAISEVGLAIMIGGNIRGYTRTMTTAMALETQMGNLELSMALGIILLILALIAIIVPSRLQQRQ